MWRGVITGTDTGIGKTVVAAMLTAALRACYWKPVQAGMLDDTDTMQVRRLTGLPEAHFLPEHYRLQAALSPHRAAELEGVALDIAALAQVPEVAHPLVIEGAGGVLVPLTRRELMIDLFALWKLPAIVCARTALGTINHSLLTLAALRARQIAVHGIIFVGDDVPDSMRTIAEFSGVRILGRLPHLPELTGTQLRQAFAEHFRMEDFT
ncbi:MAG: dethiobiotin synthase [Alphaproteobacteria bacterium]